MDWLWRHQASRDVTRTKQIPTPTVSDPLIQSYRIKFSNFTALIESPIIANQIIYYFWIKCKEVNLKVSVFWVKSIREYLFVSEQLRPSLDKFNMLICIITDCSNDHMRLIVIEKIKNGCFWECSLLKNPLRIWN